MVMGDAAHACMSSSHPEYAGLLDNLSDILLFKNAGCSHTACWRHEHPVTLTGCGREFRQHGSWEQALINNVLMGLNCRALWSVCLPASHSQVVVSRVTN